MEVEKEKEKEDNTNDHIEALKQKPKRQIKPPKTRDLISSLKANPTRLKNLRDSLKAFTLIKKNIYLDRKRKQPKNDEL